VHVDGGASAVCDPEPGNGKERLLFGTAGVPPSTSRPSSLLGVAQIRTLGLDCMELAFVRSVRMGPDAAARVKQAAREQRVALSVHAPYYINLNSSEPDKIEASRTRILKAARVGWECGARHIVFHAGFYHEDPVERVYERIRLQLSELGEQLRAEGVDVLLRPETTGKDSQFGTLAEIVELSRELDMVAPCIDFSHVHSRTQGNNSYDAFVAQLTYVEERLGGRALSDLHIHVSGIAYGARGERKHLMLDDSDLAYEDLLRALIDVGGGGRVICESPNTEQDALLLQRTYRRLLGPAS